MKLEKVRGRRSCIARVAVEYLVDVSGQAVDPAIREWLASTHSRPLVIPENFLGAYRGILAPRAMLVPVFDDWETAVERQQHKLMALARSRTNEPAT